MKNLGLIQLVLKISKMKEILKPFTKENFNIFIPQEMINNIQIHPKKDLTGERINNILIICQGNDYIKPNGKRETRWVCQCFCENHTLFLAYGDKIKKGEIKSCGCKNKTTAKKIVSKRYFYERNLNLKEKQCSICKRILPISNFSFNSHYKDGYNYQCKECYLYTDKARYHSFVSSAKQRNIKVDISLQQFLTITKNSCYYCKDYSNYYLGQGINGLDRINSNIGYEINNVVSCCRSCNIAKMELSQKDFIFQIVKIYEFFIKK